MSLPVSSAEAWAKAPSWSLWNAATGEGEPVQLRLGRRDEPRVPVAEVQRRVGRQQIEVLLALGVGDPGTLTVGDDDREGVVVVGAVALDLFAWIHGRSLASQSPLIASSCVRNHPVRRQELQLQLGLGIFSATLFAWCPAS